jgi:glucose/arabinose dehydrogenase/PKD repeat protein
VRRVLLLAFALFVVAAPSAGAATVPPGFEDVTIASGLNFPTAVTYAPDGRIFVAEQPGRVRVILADGTLRAQPLLEISDHVNSYKDRGLIGIAADADFATNGYLYLSYTHETNPSNPSGPKTARLTRVTVSPSNTVSPETVLLGSVSTVPCPSPSNSNDCIPSEFGTHSIGGVRADPDGTIWLSSGDGAPHPPNQDTFRAFNEQSLAGKVIHIDRNGNGLSGHPFCPGETNLTKICTKIYAKGFRNPFRFTLRPFTGPAIGDVGWNTREEWSLVSPGRNYGWPCYEGTLKISVLADDPKCVSLYSKAGQPDGPVMPIHECSHPACSAAVAGPVYSGTSFPAEYVADLFITDYEVGFIRRLILDADGHVTSVIDFAERAWGAVDLQQTPAGALAYVNYGVGDPNTGTLNEIRYVAANRAPVARASASPQAGPAPLEVAFDGRGSSDPDGDTLTYSWNFGDGGMSSEATPLHTYTEGTRNFTATLTVRDPSGATDTTNLTVYPGNTRPSVSVDAPLTFRAGQPVTMSASAVDAEDGTIPGSGLTWTVKLIHREHVHHLADATGQTASFATQDDHDADSHYEVTVSATDSRGLAGSSTAVISPETRSLTLDSSPSGITLTYDGTPYATPHGRSAAVGFRTSVSAPDIVSINGQLFEFVSWTDGGSRVHDLVVPPQDLTLRATYQETARRGEALLVVKDPAALGAGDTAVKSRLESLRYTVVVRSELAPASEAEGKALVVISSTVSAGAVHSKFRAVPVPVVVWEASVFDDMGLTGAASGSDFGEQTNKTSVVIAAPSHPLAAGLSGARTALSSPQTFKWGRPAATAVRVATLGGDGTKATIFGYDKGSALVSSTAPERRVGFFLHDQSATVLSADGWKLFEAAVNWADGIEPPPPPPLPPPVGAVLLVAGSTSLTAGDQALKTHLDGLRYTVTVVDDNFVGPADTLGKDVVLVSSSSGSSAIGTRLRDIAVPAVVWESALFDDMALTGPNLNTDFGELPGKTTVTIAAAGDPLAAGLTGTAAVYGNGQVVKWGRPPASSVRVATVAGDATRATIFRFHAGAALVGGAPAPARRVGFFLHDPGTTALTGAGWSLVDAAVNWADNG